MKKRDGDNSSSREDRVKRKASDWLAKEDRGFTAKEQDAFFEWLAEDPLHAELYSKRRMVWKELDILADWKPEHSIEPNPDLLAAPAPSRAHFWIGLLSGMAALLVFGLYILSPWERSDRDDVVILASGVAAKFYESHTLDDGSIVELNRGAQVATRFTKEKRLVDLLSGEAHFTVAKDPSRPFVVRARGAVVQAVGTAFSVLVDAETVEVFVVEGRVLMNPSVAPANSIIMESAPLVRELAAGQRSVVSFLEELIPPVVEDISAVELTRRLEWKNEMLDFTDALLPDVIVEFNRRNRTQLVIGDSHLNDLKVTAALKPSNIEGLVGLLETFEKVRVDRSNGSQFVLTRERN